MCRCFLSALVKIRALGLDADIGNGTRQLPPAARGSQGAAAWRSLGGPPASCGAALQPGLPFFFAFPLLWETGKRG